MYDDIDFRYVLTDFDDIGTDPDEGLFDDEEALEAIDDDEDYFENNLFRQ